MAAVPPSQELNAIFEDEDGAVQVIAKAIDAGPPEVTVTGRGFSPATAQFAAMPPRVTWC
jgi:hypothetical protein